MAHLFACECKEYILISSRFLRLHIFTICRRKYIKVVPRAVETHQSLPPEALLKYGDVGKLCLQTRIARTMKCFGRLDETPSTLAPSAGRPPSQGLEKNSE